MTNHNQLKHSSHLSPAGGPHPNPVQNAKAGSRALVTGLDILEFLATCPTPPAQSAISAALNIPLSTVFRSLAVLEERGYIARIGNQDLYKRTEKLCELQSTAPTHQRLLTLAKPIMQSLCISISQSCNLAVPSLPDMLVAAQYESPGPCGINVPLGFRYDIPASAPGLAFAAFTKNSDPARWPAEISSVVDAHEWSTLKKAIHRAAEAGFAQVENPYLPEVIDLSCPIIERGQFVAALTVPYIKTAGSTNLTWCLAALQQAAEELNESLHGDALVA